MQKVPGFVFASRSAIHPCSVMLKLAATMLAAGRATPTRNLEATALHDAVKNGCGL